MSQSRLTTTLSVAGILAVGLGVGLFLGKSLWNIPPTNILELRENRFNPNFTFINPLLGCSVHNNEPKEKELRDVLQKVINQKIVEKQATSVSVYFDTRDGNSFTINPDELYYPASMMKVPLLMAYLHAAETDHTLLAKKILYTGGTDQNTLQLYKPALTLVPGKKYTVEELLIRLIAYSDNNAVPLLITNIDLRELFQTYTELGVTIPAGAIHDYMTVGDFSRFFRILHNSTYLTWDMSEKAFEILAKKHFAVGLAAGTPSSTPISQKFGEASFTPPDKPGIVQKELHDCGVIYYPNHPYLLCVMTKGEDIATLATTIQSLSKVAYTYMENTYH